MSLEEAIEQLITLGDKDPLTIARKIMKRNDKHWLANALSAHAEDFLAEMARKRLGSQRRAAELELRPGDTVATSELGLRSAWVPGENGGHWKRAADLTAEDLEAKAKWYDGLAKASLRRAMWLRDRAKDIRAQGVETLGQIAGALPPLPDDDDLELGATT